MHPDPGQRRTALILTGAAALLLLSIWIGKSMGDRVIRKATEEGQTGVGTTVQVSASAGPSDATPFGVNWKRTQVLAAAGDPGFPDPRVPPVPLPTAPPTPKPSPTPRSTPTPGPTQAPLATATPYAKPTSPYLLHGPTVTPVPVNPKNAPTPEASPILGPSNPPPG